jgi:hypothetical protein
VFASRYAGVLGGKAEALTRRVPGSTPTASLETFFPQKLLRPLPPQVCQVNALGVAESPR